MLYNVVSVGILVTDIIVNPVDKISGKGMLDNVSSIEMFTGGNAMTVAINIAKLGLNSAVIGKIGNDALGDFLIEKLSDENVTATGVKRTDNAQTSSSIVLSGSDGERSFLHCKGANAVFDIKDIDFDIIKNANIVFVTGSLLLDNFDGVQTVEFLKRCKELGKTTALDVCWDSSVDCKWIADSALKYIDVFMPSIDEAKMISGEDELEKMADFFFANGAKTIVIKCGKDGAYVKENTNKKGYIVDSDKVENAVDTTGAGDSFCSGFLCAYSKGLSLRDCVRFGNAVGACCVKHKGATSGTLSYNETLKLMK